MRLKSLRPVLTGAVGKALGVSVGIRSVAPVSGSPVNGHTGKPHGGTRARGPCSANILLGPITIGDSFSILRRMVKTNTRSLPNL